MKQNTVRRNFIGAVALIMALLIIIPVITLVLLTNEYDERIRAETEQVSASIRQTVRTFIDGAYSLSYELAENPSILTMDGTVQTPILESSVRRNEYLELLYVQGMDGNQTARSGGEPGYRGERAWFLKMVETKQPYVQESYYSIATGMPVTSVFIPMFLDGEMVGIFGADISLRYFQQLAEQFASVENGRISFIIDGDGVVVAHPDIELLETITNFKTHTRVVPVTDASGAPLRNPDGSVVTEEQEFRLSEGYEHVIADVMAGGHGLEIIESEGREYYASFESIEMPGASNPWSVITLQDRDIAMRSIVDLIFRVVLVIAVIFAVFTTISYRYFHSLRKTMQNLETAKIEAEEANKSKSAFLSTMSHEIRTPMNAILGITEILLQRDDLHPEIKTALERTYTSGSLLLNIINDILDLSKIEAGKLELVVGKYEIASMLSDTAQLNMMRIGSKNLEFELLADENLPKTLSGDELRVKQILNNLLSNAFKYTEEGKVTLKVAGGGTSRKWKVESGKHAGAPDSAGYRFETLDNQYEDEITLIFEISDTGQGMTDEQVAMLFNEYTRFNMEANRKTEGTGLGLSITNKLVKMMDGDITVSSKPGVGSVFTVRLKQVKAGEAVLGKEMTENLKRFRSGESEHRKLQIKREPMPYGNVMIVDDVETNIYVAKGLLAPYGMTVDSALCGADAIKKVETGGKYDIIFMDHMMPDMDGIETTKRIRDMGYSQPIIALTANAVAGQADVFLNSGFDDFISKPIDMRQMNAILNKFIRDKQPPEVIEAARKNAVPTAPATSTMPTAPMEHASPAPPTAPATDAYSGFFPADCPADPEIIKVFLRDAGKALAKLDEIIGKNGEYDDDDLRTFTINVHGLKSTLAVIGRYDLSDTAKGLEAKGREKDKAEIAANAPAFIEDLRALAAELEKAQDAMDIEALSKDGSGETAQDDTALLREKLNVIKAACDSFDSDAVENALSELKAQTWTKPTQTLLEAITEHLLHSDFDEIISIIEKK